MKHNTQFLALSCRFLVQLAIKKLKTLKNTQTVQKINSMNINFQLKYRLVH